MFKPLVRKKKAVAPKKLSHNDKAEARVVECLKAGKVLKAYSPITHEDLTVGPYQEAVDTGKRFAIIGTKTDYITRWATAEEAAGAFVAGRVGSTRAREAAIQASKA